MTDVHKVFCLNLILRREELGWSQEKFAEKMGTSLRYAQYLEAGYKTGRHWPSPSKIRQLAKIMKVDSLYFFQPIKKN